MDKITLDGFDLGAALGVQPEPPQRKPEKPKFVKGKTGDIKVSHRMSKRPVERKGQSEKALEEAIQRWSFREGDCYHCFTFGDVDFITFVKFIIRQQHVPYLAISSWVVSGEDLLDLQDWHRRGLVGRVDLFLGEIFERSYPKPTEQPGSWSPNAEGGSPSSETTPRWSQSTESGSTPSWNPAPT